MSTKKIVLAVIAVVVIVGGGLLAYQVVTITGQQRAIQSQVVAKSDLTIYCAALPNTTPTTCSAWAENALIANIDAVKACTAQHNHEPTLGTCLQAAGISQP